MSMNRQANRPLTSRRHSALAEHATLPWRAARMRGARPHPGDRQRRSRRRAQARRWCSPPRPASPSREAEKVLAASPKETRIEALAARAAAGAEFGSTRDSERPGRPAPAPAIGWKQAVAIRQPPLRQKP